MSTLTPFAMYEATYASIIPKNSQSMRHLLLDLHAPCTFSVQTMNLTVRQHGVVLWSLCDEAGSHALMPHLAISTTKADASYTCHFAFLRDLFTLCASMGFRALRRTRANDG